MPQSSSLFRRVVLTGRVPAAACPRRLFHSGLDEARINRLRRSTMVRSRPQGRQLDCINFEKRITVRTLNDQRELFQNLTPDVAVVFPVALWEVTETIPLPSLLPAHYDARLFPCHDALVSATNESEWTIGGPRYPTQMVRFLQKNSESTTLRLPPQLGGALVIFVVDPLLDTDVFQREEAQVELMTAYRNILYDVCDTFETVAKSKGGAAAAKSNTPVRSLRIPALSAYLAGDHFERELGKLTQQSIIKAYHRLGEAEKESIHLSESFSISICVPPPLAAQFETAFLEEAWEAPVSHLIPNRVAMYPNLPPPRQMLELEGWVGKRQELIDAVETQGHSLLGPQKTLDGKTIALSDVQASINVFQDFDVEALSRREQATAEAQGLKKIWPNEPLKPGLQYNEQ